MADFHDLVGKQYDAASGDVTLFTGDCRFYRLIVRKVGATAASVDIYDGSSAAGTRIGTIRIGGTEDYSEYGELIIRNGYYCDTSLTLDVTAGTIEITAVYFVEEGAAGTVA